MRLSEILREMSGEIEYKIEEEQEFKQLALVASILEEAVCTFLDNPKFMGTIKDNVVMLLIAPENEKTIKEQFGDSIGYCITENPRILFFMIHNFLKNNKEYTRQIFTTRRGTNCNIHSLASIAENNVIIGNNVVIEEFVVIRENTVIGDNSIIRAGAKIGVQGYEFKHTNNKILSVEHLGGVNIGEEVEVQYNTCIDRAVYPWDNTVIGNYSKLDNLVHIGHAVKIAENVMIVAQSGIGGRTIIGANTWIGFGATVINGIEVGEEARVNIGAIATKTIKDNESVSGNFAIEHKKFIEHIKMISK
jgi:UDP-3-O-[3-hydroxymyristoyl] glucosamine N-acyltransferase